MIRHKQTHSPPPRIVEGTLTPKGATPYRAARRRLWIRRALPVLLAIFALEVCYLTLGQSATVRLTPVRLTADRTITVNAQVHPGPHDVAARRLEVTQTITTQVQATGTQMLQARPAHGLLQWLNADLAPHLVPAHTRISVSEGLLIETTQAVLVPPATPPLPGQAQAEAQAVQPGTIGNIAAKTLVDHACCGQGVLVSNPEAFSDGQDGGQVQVVLQQDLEGAVAAQKASLVRTAGRQLVRTAAPAEQVQVAGCDSRGVADPPVGSSLPAPGTFQVRVEVRCQGLAFETEAVQEQAITSALATTRPADATAYQFHLAASQITTMRSIGGEHVQITVQVRGAWIYRLSSAMKDAVRSKLAGSPWWQVPQRLSQVRGINGGHITCWWLWLPTDPEHITLLDP